MSVCVSRRYLIRALHNLNNPDLSDGENSELYGMCYRLHGHDYQVLVTVEATINALTGLSVDRGALDELVHQELIEPLDGKLLNEIYPNTSGEALSSIFFETLRAAWPKSAKLAGVRLVQLSLQETRKNWFSHTQALASSSK